MKRECEIQRDVCDWLEDQGHMPLALVLVGRRGFPDLTVMLNTGKTVYIEMKRPGGKTSFHQDRFIIQLQKRKVPVAVCDSLEKVKKFVAKNL